MLLVLLCRTVVRLVGRLDNKSFAVEPVAAADEQGSVNMGDVAANKSFKLDERGIVEVVPPLLAWLSQDQR